MHCGPRQEPGTEGSRVRRILPEGEHENSPAIYRWENGWNLSPVGTAGGIRVCCTSAVPPGLQYNPTTYPAMNRWAIFASPSGTRKLRCDTTQIACYQ